MHIFARRGGPVIGLGPSLVTLQDARIGVGLERPVGGSAARWEGLGGELGGIVGGGDLLA